MQRKVLSDFSPQKLDEDIPCKGVVIVGASGSGKSSFLSLIRRALGGCPGVEFPVRLTTRRARPDDSPLENQTIRIDELNALTSADKILLRWEKRIGSDRRETYAFLRSTASVVILGGNDELISNSASIQPNAAVLDQLLKIAVVCDPAVRARRLLERSPELSANTDELETRLSVTPSSVLDICDFIVDNTEGFTDTDVVKVQEVVVAISTNRRLDQ